MFRCANPGGNPPPQEAQKITHGEGLKNHNNISELPLFLSLNSRVIRHIFVHDSCSWHQPTEPSISNSINLFISTAYSKGNSFTMGSINPFTIIKLAS